MPSQKTKFNTFEGFLVPGRRTWVIEWSDPSDGSGKASDLIVRGKYVARNVTKKGGQLKAKPNKIASVWLYEGTIVEFTNQAVVDSARLEVYADTVKPPFKLPDWFAPVVAGATIIIAVAWMVLDATTGDTHEYWENAAEELKRPET